MKKTILASVGSVLLSVLSPVFAADLPPIPVKGAPAPYIAPYYNWTGFYVGINGGYGWGTSSHTFPTAGTTTGNFGVSGLLVGGTLGYNWQFGAFVFGLEGDMDWSNIKGSTACPGAGFTCETRNNWLGTGRGRIGYAFDRWLPYFTAGGAYGDIKATVIGPVVTTSESASRFGWTIGGGVEAAVFGNWTAKVEYLYVDLGSFDCSAAGCQTGGGVDTVTFKTNIVRAGLNYRF
jgi:outer membrane immunogenic protein